MDDTRTHEMQFARIHPSGAQEWFCPACGRRLLMQWPPSFEKKVLAPGDEYAGHTGGKVKPTRGTFTADERPSFDREAPEGVDDFETIDAFSLDAFRPWLKWVREAGLDDLWSQAA